jgi:hypothetical protein
VPEEYWSRALHENNKKEIPLKLMQSVLFPGDATGK